LSAMPRAPSASPGCGPGSGSCPERGFSEIKFSKPRFSEPRFSTRPLFSADPSNRAVHQSRRNRPENCGSRGAHCRGSGHFHQCHSVPWDRAHRGAGGLFVPASRRIVPDGEFRVAPRWGCGSSHLRNLLRVHDDSYFRFPRATRVSGCHAQGGPGDGIELLGPRSAGDDSPSLHSIRTGNHASVLAGDWSGTGGDRGRGGLGCAEAAPASVTGIRASRVVDFSLCVRTGSSLQDLIRFPTLPALKRGAKLARPCRGWVLQGFALPGCPTTSFTHTPPPVALLSSFRTRMMQRL
jgi:hypothetical protein